MAGDAKYAWVVRGLREFQPRFELGEVAHPDCDWMLAQGDADDVVPPEAVLSWAERQPRKPRLHVLHGAGHFFHGKLHELKPLVIDFLRA